MEELKREFIGLIEKNDKAGCIELVNDWLDSGKVPGIVELYQNILKPALCEMFCDVPEAECIWKEHVRSSIIRTVIESCYLRVAGASKRKFGVLKGPRAMVVCPTGELHEIGARMVADYFTLSGFEVTLIGANTPLTSIISAIEVEKPKYVAMSVTNSYNLMATQKVISLIKKSYPDITVIVGGQAFLDKPNLFREIGADMEMQTIEEISKLAVE